MLANNRPGTKPEQSQALPLAIDASGGDGRRARSDALAPGARRRARAYPCGARVDCDQDLPAQFGSLNLARIRPNFARIRRTLARIRRTLAPTSTRFGPKSAKLDQLVSELGQTRQKLARTRVDIDYVLPDFDQTWSEIDQSRPDWDTARPSPNSTEFGPPNLGHTGRRTIILKR